MAGTYAKDQPHGFVNRIERVTIVGASGRIGRQIAKAIIDNGKHDISFITRPESDSELPQGHKVTKVDYSGEDLTALVDALRGQDCLVVCMAATAPRDNVSKFIRAAAQAQVPYIMPNWFGVGPDSTGVELIREHGRAVVAEIEQLGVSSYMLLVSQFWYEFSLGGGPNRYGFDFVKKSVILFDGGDKPINTTTWPQSARAVVSLLSLKILPDDVDDKSTTLSQFVNGPVNITSFRLTQTDMFESIKRVTKTTDADWTIAHESSKVRYEEAQTQVQSGDLSAFTKFLYSAGFMGSGLDLESTVDKLDNEALGLPVEVLDVATAEAVRMGLAGEVPFGH